jgi:hypothetical protein
LSSVFSNRIGACILIEAIYGRIALHSISLFRNLGVNAQAGITILNSNALIVENSIFNDSSYNNYENNGLGGHVFAQSRSFIF